MQIVGNWLPKPGRKSILIKIKDPWRKWIYGKANLKNFLEHKIKIRKFVFFHLVDTYFYIHFQFSTIS